MTAPRRTAPAGHVGRPMAPPPDPATLRRAAETRVKQRRAVSPPLTEADLKHFQLELEVHQVELEMQNESLLVTQTELQTALEHYADLYDFAPVGYLTLGPDGEIRNLNLAAATLLGAERSRLVNRRLEQFIGRAHRAACADFLQEVFAGQNAEACEVILSPAAEPLTVVRLEAVSPPSGQECQAVLNNITEHKRAEEALERSARAKERLRQSIAALNACPNLEAALDCLVRKILELEVMDCGAVYLIEGPEAVLRHQAGLGLELSGQVARLPLSAGYLQGAMEHPGEAFIDVTRFPKAPWVSAAHGLPHVYCLALYAERHPFSFLLVGSRHPEPPSADSLELMRILALETQFLLRRLKAEEWYRGVFEVESDALLLVDRRTRAIVMRTPPPSGSTATAGRNSSG